MQSFDIVFEAGGAKGLAFIGALDVLLRSGHTPRRLIGTSAGAITATCIAAGYTPQAMQEVAGQKRGNKATFASFLDPPVAEDFPAAMREQSDMNRVVKNAVDSAVKSEPVDKYIKKMPVLVQGAARGMLAEVNKPLLDALLNSRYFLQLFALTETGGMYTDRKFLEWLKEQLQAKGFGEGVTLKAFHEKTKRDLTLAAADTTDKELLMLNHRTAPDCPVLYAVRMSMSIPFVWPDVEWRAEWGKYRGRAKAGNFIVDGSVLSNFPLRYFVDCNNKEVCEVMGKQADAGVRKLGLLLDETKPVPNSKTVERNPTKLGTRVNRLVDAVTGSWDQEIIVQYPDEICRIGCKGIGTLEFDMDEERLEAVVNSGRCAMTEYLQQRKLGAK